MGYPFNPWTMCAYCGGPLDKYGCANCDDDEAQARADAAQDERDLEREISKGPWPR